jgi:hypothetical protein
MLSDKPSAQKKKVVSTRIFGETGCNHILEHFLLVKSPTKGLNVLKIPFREVTPGVGEHFKPGARKGQSDRLASSWNKDSQPEALLCPRLDSGDPPDALSYDLTAHADLHVGLQIEERTFTFIASASARRTTSCYASAGLPARPSFAGIRECKPNRRRKLKRRPP